MTQVRSLADLPEAMSDLAAAAGRADPTTSDDWIEAPAVRAPAGRPAPRRSDGVGADLAAAVDVHRRLHLRVVSPCRGRDRQRVRRLRSALPDYDLEDAARRRPGHVLAPSEPYSFGERHRAELEQALP